MIHFLLLHTADTNLSARFRKLDVSQQSLMELFVADLADVRIAKIGGGDFIDITEWSILEFDDEQNIVSIAMDGYEEMGADSLEFDLYTPPCIKSECFGFKGTINFAYVPVTTKHLEIIWLDYEGTLDTADLPDSLVLLDLRGNAFGGSFYVKGLPRNIQTIVISNNRFSGSLHMESLPSKVTEFDMSENEFHGTVNLNALPKDIITLNLKNNKLEGTISLVNPPKQLHEIFLSGNKFDTQRLVMDDSILFGTFAVDTEFQGKIERPDGTPYTPAGLLFELESDSDSVLDEMPYFSFFDEDD